MLSTETQKKGGEQVINANLFNAYIAAKGETQADAARVLGINPSTLYRKITGISDFYREEIETFCRHYGANPNDIFFSPCSAFTQNENAEAGNFAQKRKRDLD